MKKVVFTLIIMFMSIMLVQAADNDLVKVYIFEAGGCPWCEQERNYLESLDSYEKKFTIVTKKLYVDHDTWAPDTDYNLGVKVANAFQERGFEDADYQGTPFVIISDLYAATGYNTSLESYIDKAYSKGDKDVVGCLERGETNCFPAEEKSNVMSYVIIIGLVVVIALAIIARKKANFKA